MFISGDPALPVFEVELESFNILTSKHEHNFEYVHAKDEQSAKAASRWIYGSCVDILSVSLD